MTRRLSHNVKLPRKEVDDSILQVDVSVRTPRHMSIWMSARHLLTRLLGQPREQAQAARAQRQLVVEQVDQPQVT